MNRREFAEYFGIPYRTVQEWELGHREMPGYLLRLMYYHEKTKEKEQLLPKMQSEDGKISIVRDVDGKNIVIINDEAHHAYRIPAELKNKKIEGLSKEDQEEATRWIEGLDRIHKKRNITRIKKFSIYRLRVNSIS